MECVLQDNFFQLLARVRGDFHNRTMLEGSTDDMSLYCGSFAPSAFGRKDDQLTEEKFDLHDVKPLHVVNVSYLCFSFESFHVNVMNKKVVFVR